MNHVRTCTAVHKRLVLIWWAESWTPSVRGLLAFARCNRCSCWTFVRHRTGQPTLVWLYCTCKNKKLITSDLRYHTSRPLHALWPRPFKNMKVFMGKGGEGVGSEIIFQLSLFSSADVSGCMLQDHHNVNRLKIIVQNRTRYLFLGEWVWN